MIPKDPPHITISHAQRAAIEAKASQRMAARNFFIKEMSNPYNYNSHHGLEDTAMMRVEANRTFKSQLHFFRPNMRSFSWLAFSLFVPVTVLYHLVMNERDTFDEKCRRGEIAYKDRNFKLLY